VALIQQNSVHSKAYFYSLTTAELHKVFSLSQLTQSIENLLRPQFSKRYWIKAEMNRLNFHARTGGCYPELVEKREDQVIAQVKAVLWKRNYDRINDLFLQILKEPLKDGSELLLEVSIHYDAVRGLNLFVHDISIEFAIGQLEKQRSANLLRLQNEDLIDKNKRLSFPIIPKCIAVISDQTSDGFLDFIQVLKESRWKDSFYIHLFPSVLQGNGAIHSIPTQLKRIEAVSAHFDLVAIIRGGGSDLDMSCFNSYEISAAIAHCKLPVLTGIGHSTNLTLSEQVAHKNGITPTALGTSIVEHIDQIWEPIVTAKNTLLKRSLPIIKNRNEKIEQSQKWLHLKGKSTISSFQHQLEELALELGNSMRFRNRVEIEKLNHFNQIIRIANRNPKEHIESQKWIIQRLSHAITRYKNREDKQLENWGSELSDTSNILLLSKRNTISETQQLFAKTTLYFLEKETIANQRDARIIRIADPKNVLERGFTISRINGKVVSSKKDLKQGELLETEWKEGLFLARIETNNDNKNEL